MGLNHDKAMAREIRANRGSMKTENITTENAPPSVNPVTVGGRYLLTDGTYADFCWIDGRLVMVRRYRISEDA